MRKVTQSCYLYLSRSGGGLPRMRLQKLSEKGRRGLQRSSTERPKVQSVLRIAAKSTLGALLAPLFGQFLEGGFCELRLEGVLGEGSAYLDYNHLICLKTA
jgi:hypothetical protein